MMPRLTFGEYGEKIPLCFGCGFFFFFFFLGGAGGEAHQVAGGILVPRPGVEPTSPALEAQTINLWAAREVLKYHCFKSHFSL